MSDQIDPKYEAYRAADLLAENDSLRRSLATALASLEQKGATGPYLMAIVALSILGVAAVTTIVVVRPEKDYTSTISILLGFLVPIVSALLAAAVHQVSTSMNGRLSQLLVLTAKSSRAEGVEDQRRAAAATGQQEPKGSIA